MPSARGVVMTIVVTAFFTPFLTACGSSGVDEECSHSFESAALSVPQVVSAEFECENAFGNPTQMGTIVLDVESQKQANPVIKKIYKAFAADESLRDALVPILLFETASGAADINDSNVDFEGSPSIGEMRDAWNVKPNQTE